jgi:hypothetical protein
LALKLGQRVTVLPGVSPCRDAVSLLITHGEGLPRDKFIGMKGEVVQIGSEYLRVKVRVGTTAALVDDPQCGPSEVPAGCESMVLVDSQVVNGVREGKHEMREFFLESELEVG